MSTQSIDGSLRKHYRIAYGELLQITLEYTFKFWCISSIVTRNKVRLFDENFRFIIHADL